MSPPVAGSGLSGTAATIPGDRTTRQIWEDRMPRRMQDDVAHDAWRWLERAEKLHLQRDVSVAEEREIQELQAMAMCALAAIAAEQARY